MTAAPLLDRAARRERLMAHLSWVALRDRAYATWSLHHNERAEPETYAGLADEFRRRAATKATNQTPKEARP